MRSQSLNKILTFLNTKAKATNGMKRKQVRAIQKQIRSKSFRVLGSETIAATAFSMARTHKNTRPDKMYLSCKRKKNTHTHA